MHVGQIRRLRSIVGGSIGNLVEYYDWYVYAAFSLYFAKSFFPHGDQTAQLLNAAAVFAAGFLARPLGAWILGRWSDRHGRKSALLVSVWLMGGGSLLIALTPSFETIGVLAPALLVLARVIQGLSVGGEYGASATYLSEIADHRHRGFWASWQYVTLIGGQLLALAVLMALQSLLTEAELQSWGWRIPFVLGAFASLSALLLRRGIDETPAFASTATTERRASLRALLRHPRALLTVVGLSAGGALYFYTFTTYMQKFLVNSAGLDKIEATRIAALPLVVFMILQPVFGALSDRIGRRRQVLLFSLAGMLLTVPVMGAISRAETAEIALLLIVAALGVCALYSSISGVIKAELFPVHIRTLGVGLPFAFTVSLFGGTAEYVGLLLKSAGHESAFYWYVTAMMAVTFLAALALPRSPVDLDEISDRPPGRRRRPNRRDGPTPQGLKPEIA